MTDWWLQYDYDIAEPCWVCGPGGICETCGKPWPTCLSDAGIASLYQASDMLDEEGIQLLEQEIELRGLDEPHPL